MLATASATGGHAIGATFGAFSMLAIGTTAPASTRVFPFVFAYVHICPLNASAQLPFTSTIASFFAQPPTTTASISAETIAFPCLTFASGFCECSDVQRVTLAVRMQLWHNNG